MDATGKRGPASSPSSAPSPPSSPASPPPTPWCRWWPWWLWSLSSPLRCSLFLLLASPLSSSHSFCLFSSFLPPYFSLRFLCWKVERGLKPLYYRLGLPRISITMNSKWSLPWHLIWELVYLINLSGQHLIKPTEKQTSVVEGHRKKKSMTPRMIMSIMGT